jgi:N-terminal domain of galactosyltransferase
MFVPEVTVVLPLYGVHEAARALPAVIDAWLAQEMPCEVIVAVAGERRGLSPCAPADGRVRILAAASHMSAPGLLRNLAASAARARALYLGDADIVPLGRDFLTRASDLRGDGAVVQPWMYRLVNAGDLTPRPSWQAPGADCFCLAIGDGNGRLTAVGDERVAYTDKGVPAILPPRGAELPGDDRDAVIRMPFHVGGVLVGRELFESVGGYCRLYRGWGAEDDDLLFKLACRAKVVIAWRTARDLACLHYEHPRPCATPELADNRALLRRRCLAGAEAMIHVDCQDASHDA